MTERTELNQLYNFKLLKRNLDDIDLSKAKIIDPAEEKSNLINKSNLIREAKKLGYNPNDLDLSSPKEKAFTIKNDLKSAKSFGELDGKLSKKDLWIDRKNEEFVFTDGFSSVKAAEIDTDFKVTRLKRNYGEDLSKYLKVRNDGIDIKGAESRVQSFFDQEVVKDLRNTRKDVKSKLEDVRYELASIQTSPKATRNTSRKETLLAQKSKLLKDHKNLTAEIASLEKGGRFGPGIDRIKSQINHIKSRAGRIGKSASLARKGYKINKLSMDGMQSAREAVGIQKAFKNKISKGTRLPSKLKSLKSVTSPTTAVAYKAYSTFSRMANDPEMAR